jgi:hypothetical protein
MLTNKPKETNTISKNAYYQTSLPKIINNTNKSTSTRCISVSKQYAKQVQGIPKLITPKQLTVTSSSMQFYLGKGNNSGLVRRLLGFRPTWIESEDSTSAFINLKWQQDQKGMKYEWLIDSAIYRGLMNQF